MGEGEKRAGRPPEAAPPEAGALVRTVAVGEIERRAGRPNRPSADSAGALVRTVAQQQQKQSVAAAGFTPAASLALCVAGR